MRTGSLPYAAGTILVHHGRESRKPTGPGSWQIVFPGTVVARQHVAQNQTFRFNLPAGRYVLVARLDRSNATAFLDVSIAGGEAVTRDIPNSCR